VDILDREATRQGKQTTMVRPTQERALVGDLDTTRSPHRVRIMFLGSITASLRAKDMASLPCGRWSGPHLNTAMQRPRNALSEVSRRRCSATDPSSPPEQNVRHTCHVPRGTPRSMQSALTRQPSCFPSTESVTISGVPWIRRAWCSISSCSGGGTRKRRSSFSASSSRASPPCYASSGCRRDRRQSESLKAGAQNADPEERRPLDTRAI
jgi:hypothetical protein